VCVFGRETVCELCVALMVSHGAAGGVRGGGDCGPARPAVGRGVGGHQDGVGVAVERARVALPPRAGAGGDASAGTPKRQWERDGEGDTVGETVRETRWERR
jgi:hypothetical protein